MRKSVIKAAVFGVIGVAASATAFAATETTWRLDTGSTASGGCGTNTGNSGASRTCLPGASSTVTGAAWAFGGTGPGDTLAGASVYGYSGGVGVTASGESGSPNHSLDNYGKIDALLLSFTNPVTLSKITTGWVGPGSGDTRPSPSTNPPDSDFSLLAYTGGDNPSGSMTGKTAAQLLAAGWALVGQYDGPGTPSTTTVNNDPSTMQSSRKYWLVTAYDPWFGGSTSGVDIGYVSDKKQYDFLKLYSVSYKENGRVPEPGSLVLVGLALAGLWSGRRRTG